MKTDQVAAWLGSFMDIELMLIDDAAVALTTINTTPAACTVGFSQVDTGLIIDGDGATDVRCEIVTVGGVVDKQLPGRAVVAAARAIERLGIPAQPGVLLEGALDDLGTTARHGWLREPELFDRGTPLYREPDRLTLLLELVALTDDEYTIARDQGLDVLTRRLRRRGTNTTEWNREAE